MIKISKKAINHFINLLKNQEKNTQIKLSINNPGTFNAECELSYCSIKSLDLNDVELKYNKLSIYVNKHNIKYLKDAEIDFISDKLNSSVTLKAPNIKPSNLDKSASLEEKIIYWLELSINPQLYKHNGNVKLVKITNDMKVILKFGGSCNGCSLIDSTLKEGIEKKLLKKFTKIKEVIDITNHIHGDHSYM
ncbi:MAG: NfuA family Fe-S biogenesis protein [Enterobacterales bacterium]